MVPISVHGAFDRRTAHARCVESRALFRRRKRQRKIDLARSDRTGFGREGGTRNFGFSTQNETPGERNGAEAAIDGLADALRLSWTGKRQRDGFFLRAESFYNVASYLDRLGKVDPRALASYGGISLHARSHGESFLTVLVERFSGKGLYLIDEPEAALSAARQLALLGRMRVLLEHDAETQFIIATHSPIVLAYPGAQIVAFDRGAVAPVAYHDTDAYIITRRFLHDPARMLDVLFANDEPGATDEPDAQCD